MNAVEVQNLNKRFGTFLALEDVSFTVQPGEAFALLGPNGSGKTTTLKSIAGLAPPTSGQVLVEGIDVWKCPREAKSRFSYLPQRVAFPENLTAREVLEFYCRLRRVPAPAFGGHERQSARNKQQAQWFGERVDPASENLLVYPVHATVYSFGGNLQLGARKHDPIHHVIAVIRHAPTVRLDDRQAQFFLHALLGREPSVALKADPSSTNGHSALRQTRVDDLVLGVFAAWTKHTDGPADDAGSVARKRPGKSSVVSPAHSTTSGRLRPRSA